MWVPVWLHLFRTTVTRQFGGMDFLDCSMEDERHRPAILFQQPEGDPGRFDVNGRVRVSNPHGVRMQLGPRQQGVSLEVVAIE